MKPKLPWNAIEFLWRQHYVSDRKFADYLGIDRSWLRERANKQGWQVHDIPTINELKARHSRFVMSFETEKAAQYKRLVESAERQWGIAAEVLRLSIIAARG